MNIKIKILIGILLILFNTICIIYLVNRLLDETLDEMW